MSANKRLIPPAAIALTAAILFGASTPAAKSVLEQTAPELVAGLLYLGSGLGLFLMSLFNKLRNSKSNETKLKKRDLPWLIGAITFGGVFAPVLLMVGLTSTTGGAASLLLNLEAVFTALLAWFAFKENFDRRIFLGMVAIVLGSVLLSWQPAEKTGLSLGSLAIMGACLCWALDNNLTRNIADADPMQIASTKGLVAGLVNCLIALARGAHMPVVPVIAETALIGFLGYGISLVFFIKALRLLGTARTGAYFSAAPFAGAILAVLFLHEPVSINLIGASFLMALGVWLHLTEDHEHSHSHIAEEHEHGHWHDEHHQHEHPPGVSAAQPHVHWHQHESVTHSHPHFPDSKHRHQH